jgi:hypothetical protein
LAGQNPSHTDLMASPEAIDAAVERDAQHLAALAEVEKLRSERDEADRRAGAAERRLAYLEESERKREWWTQERKAELGLGQWDTFDKAWNLLKQRAEAVPELLEALKGLIPTNVNLNNRHLSDDVLLPCDVRLGELRVAAAAIAAAEGRTNG